MFSGGFSKGMSFSGACAGEQPAATPVAPSTRKKNLLPIPDPLTACSSLVAREAVDVRLPHPMALHAETHVHVLDAHVLRHVRHVAVALRALQAAR
jgi:hypothetical protein